MAISFLSFPIPKKKGLQNYKVSLRVLSAAYFAIGLLTAAVLVFDLTDNSRAYFTFITILISSSQAILFFFALITLVNPTFAKPKKVFYHTIPYFIFCVSYLISFALFGDPVLTTAHDAFIYQSNPTVWIRIAFLLFYVFQLVNYTRLFLKETKKYNKELMDYFSEVVQLKLQWVYIAFYSALAIGILAIISAFLPKNVDWIVTIILTLFYFGFALEYIKYDKVYKIVEPAILNENIAEQSVNTNLRSKSDWVQYKNEIIQNRYYCEIGLTIEGLAAKLKIGRTTLSNLINREEGINFNTCINRLRIEESKQLLISNPDLPLATIAEQVGYSEQSNFSRQFKQITGETPMVWRKTNSSGAA